MSTDNTVEIIKKFEDVNLVFEKKKGIAPARNTGLKNAKGGFIAFVDSDVILPDKWIENALELIKASDIAGVGGPGLSAEKNIVSESLDYLLMSRASDEEVFVDSIATMDILYKRKAISGLFFDESLKTGEDPDFNFKLRERGYKLLFSPKLWVWHNHPTTLKGLLKKWYNYGKNYPRPFLKHRQMIGKGFYARMAYMPLLFSLFILAFFSQIFAYMALIQVIALFAAYLVKGGGRVRAKILIPFAVIHTLKQLAQMMGIFVFMLSELKPVKRK